jgi:hypothetical protein
MAGHFLFPNPPTQDRLTLWLSGMRDKQSTQGSTQVRTVQTGDVPAIPEQTQIHAFSVQRMHKGFSAGVRPVHLLAVRESNGGGEPFSRLTLAVYSHASGLTLVTHGTACVPPARITLVRPPLPKLRIKHKMHMSFWNNIKILFPGLSPLGLAPRLNT